jgi:hypothetical protein
VTATRRCDLGALGFDGGAHVLVKLALDEVAVGGEVEVTGSHPDLRPTLRAWCTATGNGFAAREDGTLVAIRGRATRWAGASPAGTAQPGEVEDRPPAAWGLAARGVWIEPGGPEPRFALDDKDDVWADDVVRLYDRSLAGQWDPAVAIPWDAAPHPDPTVERAVVQVMTYLVENEHAALVVPARFLGQVHPHFAEVQHLLAAQVADEARHAHVFAQRAGRSGEHRTLSSAGGRASLQTLLDEPDWATASFLLSVLGEGTFLALLGFLERHAPEECTRTIARLVRADEARHVAFGVAHLERHCARDPALRARLAAAVERRHDALRSTSGLNQEVFDALVLLAAGAQDPERVAHGWAAVQQLQRDMDDGRRARLSRLGYAPDEARDLAALHTRNFM